jgi:two-component system, OmpR family, response regulator VanR
VEALELARIKNMNILVVEDDTKMIQSMVQSLQMLFAHVYTAQDGMSAFASYEKYSPDFVLTDISMPYEDGLTLTENIRKIDTQTPIIIISAFSSEDFLLKASNLQIDGYIIKPINLDKLLVSINRSLKRISHNDSVPTIVNIYKRYNFDLNSMELSLEGKHIPLGKKESLFLALLCKNLGKTTTKQDISRAVWHNEVMTNSALKNLVFNCRKKIDKNAIVSRSKRGWQLNRREEI